MDIHIFEKNITDKISNELNNVMTSVENREQDAVSTGIEKLVIPRVD